MCNFLLLKNISGKARGNLGKEGNTVFIPQTVVANSNRRLQRSKNSSELTSEIE